MMNNSCKVPFSEVEIHENGNVYVCCPAKMQLAIGNIYEQSFDEIWHSNSAQKLRHEILYNNNYCFCNLNICNPQNNIEQDKLKLIEGIKVNFTEKPDYPIYVKFCHDHHCNLKCITCRDDFYTNSPTKIQELDSKIEKYYLPILKNCKIVSLNGSGEVFASKHCRNLIKAIVKKYPDIKFDLHTNGVLCDKKNCDELGITDKIISVDVSMHSVSKKIYNKIMLGSNYEKVLSNLKWLSSLKQKGQLKRLDLYFVVQKINYKEMADFVDFAKSIDADVYFWEYRNWGNLWGAKNYEKVAIFEKFHYQYNQFAKYLENKNFNAKNCHLNNYLKQIKTITLQEHILCIIQHKLEYIKKYISKK